MKKILALSLCIFCGFVVKAQDIIENNRLWRAEQNQEFRDSASSPLTKKGLASFDSLHYFPISEKYAVQAYLIKTPDAKPFKMKTSTDRLVDYRQYGLAHFTIDGETYKIAVYQNLRLLKMPKYKDYLFIPFTDFTNDDKTYSGGRYVEAEVSEGDSLLIDFNKAYNPYCVYSHRYSCPIPPSDNHLNTRIEAGVLDYDLKKKKKKAKG